MRPDDANIVGNVHGGSILKMIEEAGCIIGTRHCNTQNGVSFSLTVRKPRLLTLEPPLFFIYKVCCVFLEQMNMIKM